MAKPTAENTFLRLKTVLDVLTEGVWSGDALNAGQVLAEATARVPFNAHEAELLSGGIPRGHKTLTSATAKLVKAGWLVKGRSGWTITEDGMRATVAFADTVTFATALDAGTPIPADEARDGISLLDTMRGQPSLSSRTLFWHYPHYHNAGIHGPASALRQGDWKLIHYYESELTGEGAADELFNLREDPGEATNLAEVQRDRLQSLRSELTTLLAEAGAQLPSVNDQFDPTRAHLLTGDAVP